VAVVGNSGKGKSNLLQLILKKVPNLSGNIGLLNLYGTHLKNLGSLLVLSKKLFYLQKIRMKENNKK
jgi:ABC-type transport system involved in cytochrome bd biosynthesis fused ATPase/permease subunit